ncbi:hypothetical protein UNPA324_23880 [Bradyrhizobium sp. UNPA324]|nr:hypothetical protein UNPA324_23880 [Bradyrhizobium sp. UNPA324]
MDYKGVAIARFPPEKPCVAVGGAVKLSSFGHMMLLDWKLSNLMAGMANPLRGRLLIVLVSPQLPKAVVSSYPQRRQR